MNNPDILCVLLLEDSSSDALLLRVTLSHIRTANIRVLHAERLSGALALLQDQAVDLVLSDLHLPDSTGVETVRALVNQAGATPVVALTGWEAPDMEAQLADAGAWGYLSKDHLLDTPALARLVQEAIQHKHALPS